MPASSKHRERQRHGECELANGFVLMHTFVSNAAYICVCVCLTPLQLNRSLLGSLLGTRDFRSAVLFKVRRCPLRAISIAKTIERMQLCLCTRSGALLWGPLFAAGYERSWFRYRQKKAQPAWAPRNTASGSRRAKQAKCFRQCWHKSVSDRRVFMSRTL